MLSCKYKTVYLVKMGKGHEQTTDLLHVSLQRGGHVGGDDVAGDPGVDVVVDVGAGDDAVGHAVVAVSLGGALRCDVGVGARDGDVQEVGRELKRRGVHENAEKRAAVDRDVNKSADVCAGTTVTSQPTSTRRRKMLRLIPKS